MAIEKKVKFGLSAPEAKVVFVAGTFNAWDVQRTPLKKGRKGMWAAEVPLPPGRYEYRFVVDGQWLSDPKATDAVPNAHGSDNSVIVV